MAAGFNPAVGSLVWIEDPDEAWLDGEVVQIKGEEIKVLCTSGKTVVVKASNVYAKDAEAPPCGVDDMTRLAYLHEPGVLANLKSRYDINEIYTYTGNILIAVNPFRKLPHLYDNHMMAQYKGAAFGELSPHPFAVADAAYRLMINEGISQSILVSGESGAGKTESTKLLMRYLAYMGGRAVSEGRTVEQQVLESNPVLEAFGNAKTVRNNNSSRFGKFVEIQFDQTGRISGAAIRTYLLERSRVCQVSDPERNYHCFYMLCAAPPEDGIFQVVAAILHLGNIEFAKRKETDSSMPKDQKSWFHLRTAAELFMCDVKALEDSLCKRIIVTRDETITKWLDPDSAAFSRDALAKIVYSRLFDWNMILLKAQYPIFRPIFVSFCLLFPWQLLMFWRMRPSLVLPLIQPPSFLDMRRFILQGNMDLFPPSRSLDNFILLEQFKWEPVKLHLLVHIREYFNYVKACFPRENNNLSS